MKTDEPRNALEEPRQGGGEDAAEERMEDWFGEKDFRKGIQAYMERFQYKNAQADDLWREIERVFYDDKLYDAESGGILRWLVAGYQKWKEHGLSEPSEVVLSTWDYRMSNDPHRLAELAWFDHTRCSIHYAILTCQVKIA